MIRRITMLVAAALLVVALAAPAALAASPEQRCTDAGGTFATGPQGAKECTFTETETAGQSHNTFESTTTVSQKGSFSSSHEKEPRGGECKNPGDQTGTNSANCPDEPPEDF